MCINISWNVCEMCEMCEMCVMCVMCEMCSVRSVQEYVLLYQIYLNSYKKIIRIVFMLN